jgi:hypothetical protein
MVASPSDDPQDLNGLGETLSANVNAGHTFGTNGPMVRVSISALSTGDVGSLDDGAPTTITEVRSWSLSRIAIASARRPRRDAMRSASSHASGEFQATW